jgi:hypothetical protein
MANLATILKALRIEVAGRIKDIKPNVKSAKRFTEYKSTSKSASPFSEFTGRVRAFEIGAPMEAEQIAFGGSTRHILYEMPLTILYRQKTIYQIAAQDDFEVIRNDLLRTSASSGVTGVSNRHIDTLEPVTAEQVSDDPWLHYTARLVAYLEIS